MINQESASARTYTKAEKENSYKNKILMKILTSMINLLLTLSVLFSACSASEMKDENAQVNIVSDSSKILIVYLSRTNNTKAIAEIIHQNTGGTLVPLELEKPYPENYQAIVQQVANENETGFLPPLKTKVNNIRDYDVVFIGFPTWGMQLPPPIKSFLKQYNLSGKTVIPFNTNAGYGIGNSFDTVKELCTNCKVSDGFTMQGGVERDGVLFVIKDEKVNEAQSKVKQWLQNIRLIK